MAPTAKDCRRIVAAATKAGIVFAVGHVMRYTSYTQKLKAMLDAGAVGDIVSLQHLEPVGYWHQATRSSEATGGTPSSPRPCSWPSRATTSTGFAT